jgi:hypothetical protein
MHHFKNTEVIAKLSSSNKIGVIGVGHSLD